jgi:hypothetical protein
MKRVELVAPVALPMLFAVFPLLSLFADNQTEVELTVLWRPLVFSLLASAVLYGLFLLIFKSGAKAAILASLVVTVFFTWGTTRIGSLCPCGWRCLRWQCSRWSGRAATCRRSPLDSVSRPSS